MPPCGSIHRPHLPAVAAKCRQTHEELQALDAHIDAQSESKTLTATEAEVLEKQRQMISEELVGWIVALETLDAARIDAQKIYQEQLSRATIGATTNPTITANTNATPTMANTAANTIVSANEPNAPHFQHSNTHECQDPYTNQPRRVHQPKVKYRLKIEDKI